MTDSFVAIDRFFIPSKVVWIAPTSLPLILNTGEPDDPGLAYIELKKVWLFFDPAYIPIKIIKFSLES